MKKVYSHFTVLCIILLEISAASAQQSGYGFSIGILNSNISLTGKNTPPKGNSIIQPAIGAVAYGNFSKKLGLCTELTYTVIGTDIEDTVSTLFLNSQLTKLDNIRVILFRWYVLPCYNIKDNFFLMAGPVVDLVSIRKYKNDLDIEHTTIGEYIVNSQNGNGSSFKVNICFGGGIMYKLFRFDLRYVMGLGNLLDNTLTQHPGYDRFTSASYNTLQATASMIIPGLGFSSSARGGRWVHH